MLLKDMQTQAAWHFQDISTQIECKLLLARCLLKSIFTSIEGLIFVYITVFNPPCFKGLSCGKTSLAKIVVLKSPIYIERVGKAGGDLSISLTRQPHQSRNIYFTRQLVFYGTQHSVIPLGAICFDVNYTDPMLQYTVEKTQPGSTRAEVVEIHNV